MEIEYSVPLSIEDPIAYFNSVKKKIRNNPLLLDRNHYLDNYK